MEVGEPEIVSKRQQKKLLKQEARKQARQENKEAKKEKYKQLAADKRKQMDERVKSMTPEEREEYRKKSHEKNRVRRYPLLLNRVSDRLCLHCTFGNVIH